MVGTKLVPLSATVACRCLCSLSAASIDFEVFFELFLPFALSMWFLSRLRSIQAAVVISSSAAKIWSALY
jgi:hypothetical protein